MPPMWWKLVKIVLLLFALFTTIVCINSEITKRREAEAAAATSSPSSSSSAAAAAAVTTSIPIDTTAFMSDSLLSIMRNKARNHNDEKEMEVKTNNQQETQKGPHLTTPTVWHELPAEDIEARVLSIFKVSDGEGVMLFNTTTFSDDAPPFMPIPTMLGDQPATASPTSTSTATATATATEQSKPSHKTTQSQSQPTQSQHYHQYHSLNHEEQSFKVQRSPDGKLNLVFTDPLISLQTTQTMAQQPPQQPHTPRKPISDSDRHRPSTVPIIDTGDHECVDGFNQSRSFCTKVNNYPDISALKGVLLRKFPNLFIDEQPPTDVGLRMQDDELHLCNSRTRYLYPKLGQRLDLTWQYIVNTEELKQGILIEECEGENESCLFLDSFPQNYTPVCKQHYVIRHLATINNGSQGTPEVANEPFKIPSCCKCVLKPKTLGGS
ncbi:protein spaetzle isoform X2 [Drosophila willistoni]|nr:protein spaetzle isoform X2 [Drosophila willistoni]